MNNATQTISRVCQSGPNQMTRRIIPLAIELAATSAATPGVSQVAVGLRDRFALLTHGRHVALARQRTLPSTLDWSHELLSDAEQHLLRYLGIFSHGFTFATAAAVMDDGVADPSYGMECIANLVAKSMVALDRDTASRWYLLNTIRAYALDNLAGHGERNTAARRHGRYFRDLFAAPAAGVRSWISTEDLTRHGREINNVRAALYWAFSIHGDHAIGIDLTADYAPIWMNRSLLAECRDRCERALQGAKSNSSSPNGLCQMRRRMYGHKCGCGLLSRAQRSPRWGSRSEYAPLATQALATAEALNDLDAQAWVLPILKIFNVYLGHEGQSRITTVRLRQIAQHTGDAAMLIIAERNTGTRLLTVGRHRDAQEYLDRALRFAAFPDDQRRSNWRYSEHRAMARALLARALWMRGFIDRAHAEAFGSLEELHDTDRQPTPPASVDHGVAAIEVVLPSGGKVLIRRDTPVAMLRAVIAGLRG